VLRALSWLKDNNMLYKDIIIPDPQDMPTPFIIDESKNVESQEINIEARMEYTVVFPEQIRCCQLMEDGQHNVNF
jgi:hypothetical protein